MIVQEYHLLPAPKKQILRWVVSSVEGVCQTAAARAPPKWQLEQPSQPMTGLVTKRSRAPKCQIAQLWCLTWCLHGSRATGRLCRPLAEHTWCVRQNKVVQSMAAAAAGSCPGPKIAYPRARADETTSEYFGTIVKDPYRWMEDVASTETAAFVKEQVALTTSYFKSSGIAARSAEITKQLTAVWDYDRIYAPRRRGSAVFFSMKQGTRDQPVMMKAASPSTEDLKAATVFLDTAAEFPGQAMALSAIDFSKDGSMLAYGLSKGGSDWLQIRVRRCSDGVDLEDVVPWVRYSGIAWRKDGAGFFYNRYAAVPGVRLPSVRQPAEALPAYETESAAGIAAAPDMAAEDADAAVEAGTETAANKNQTVYYHELGADPRLDRVVFAPLDPDW